MRTTIETQRLLLRPPVAADAPHLARGLSDFEVTRMLARPPYPYTEGDAGRWLEGVAFGAARGDAYVYALAPVAAPPACVGVISLERATAAHPFTLGYWLAHARWGEGLMGEAMAAFLAEAFETLAIDGIASGHFIDNPASARLHDRFGFETTGEDLVWSNARGEDVPHVNRRLARTAWEARRR